MYETALPYKLNQTHGFVMNDNTLYLYEKILKLEKDLNDFKTVITNLQENPREYMKQLARETNPKFNMKYEKYFANKQEIEPNKITLELEPVDSQKASELFRTATSLWNVPISSGYGRRMRFILWDKTHNKVFGIFGLGDPVIGLKVRDDYIGWNKQQRNNRLYNLMSAYILGAVSPYNELYGSKMVAMAVGSQEVCNLFESKYSGKQTIIRGRTPIPKLVAVDTMAFFGKSLIYEGLKEWQFVGFTRGLMHVHLNRFWDDIVELAKLLGVKSVEKNKYGHGPNWKFRVLQDVFKKIGLRDDLFSTGITKGYYFRPLAENWQEFLHEKTDKPVYVNKSFDEYAELWKGKYLRKRIGRFGKL
jgi:hypothetical protein